MTPERWKQVSQLYEAARARPASARAAFLAEACGSDDPLRREVQALLDQPTSPPGLEGLTSPVVTHAMGVPAGSNLTGRQFGVYLVGEYIESGGMGDVYRARDTRLGRDVAIKALQRILVADPDRVARFEREARVLAALDHPHIGTIFGVEESDGTRVLVLALVEGETLAERLARGAIPMAEALEYARQIADALGAAHNRGIVHRDLKPGNIKITSAGVIKVLDFGLAKEVAHISDPGASRSPGETQSDTRDGVILGTAAYMSPEQARGQRVDKRADIWAFGCVLYEMLTGRVAFAGETISDTITAILGREVDWSALPKSMPQSVRRLLHRCLTKDASHRLHDIADAKLEIEDAAAQPDKAPQGRSRWVARIGRLAAVALLLAVIVVGASWPRSVPDARTYRTEMQMPAGFERGGSPGRIALSPDGRNVAFAARDEAGGALLWVRAFDESAARPLAGTDRAQYPFWSPDSRTIGFYADGKLKKIAASGGASITISEAGRFFQGGTWNRDNVILFTFGGGPLFRVAADGGMPEQVTTLDQGAGETGHAFPFFLPDGRRFLYTGYTARRVADRGPFVGGVYLGSLDSSDRTQVLDRISNAEYARGHVLFVRDGALLAQPLDPTRLMTAGNPVELAEQVHISVPTAHLGSFSASEGGVLAFELPALPESEQLVWVDRQGRRIGIVGGRGNYGQRVQLSPDGTRALVSRSDRGVAPDLVVIDVSGNLERRLTSAPEAEGGPVWSPDGKKVAFARRQGPNRLYVTASSGAAAQELLPADDVSKFPESWSPDGRFLLYQQNGDLWALPMLGERPSTGSERPEPVEGRKPFQFLATRATEWDSQFSPDGRWVVYASDASGRSEIYVAPFTGTGAKRNAGAPIDKWLVSTGTAHAPRWRRDGKEIFFWSVDSNKLMAVPVRTEGPRLVVGRAEPLFDARPRIESYPFLFYDVSADGQRFLINGLVAPPEPASLALIVNWPALLKN